MGARIRGVAVIMVVLVTGAVLGSWISQWLDAPELPSFTAPPAEQVQWTGERVRVQVLNEGGVDGMAREATGFLREAGFDVVEVGNGDTFDRDTSLVRNSLADPTAARAVALLLGIPRVEDEAQGENLYEDVTVVLGKDWAPERVVVPETSGQEAPWWDLRGLLRSLKRPSAPPSSGSKLVDPENES